MSQTYTKTLGGEFSPINLLPSNLIKCVECSAYVSADDMDNHCKMHISPFYNFAIEKKGVGVSAKKGQKLNLNIMIEQDNVALDDIKSFMAQDVPKPEQQRKIPPSFSSPVHKLSRSQKSSSSTKISSQNAHSIENDLLDVESNLTETQEYPEQKQEQLILKKQLHFQRQVGNGYKKEINFYTNQNLYENGYSDQVQIKGKNGYGKVRPFNNEEEQQSKQSSKQNLGYNIVPYLSPKSKKIEKNSGPVSIEIPIPSSPRHTFEKSMINTFSTTNGSNFYSRARAPVHEKAESKVQGYFLQTPKRSLDFPSSSQNQNFQCGECHGFYCKTCGSTVPPQYRPVGRENENDNSVSIGWNLGKTLKQFYTKIQGQQTESTANSLGGRSRGKCDKCSHFQ